LKSPTKFVALENISQDECFETIASTRELAEAVAVGNAGLGVTAVGVHRTVAIGPYMQGIFLTRLGAMSGVRVDCHHAPQRARAFRIRCRGHIGEGLPANRWITVAADGQTILLRRVGVITGNLCDRIIPAAIG